MKSNAIVLNENSSNNITLFKDMNNNYFEVNIDVYNDINIFCMKLIENDVTYSKDNKPLFLYILNIIPKTENIEGGNILFINGENFSELIEKYKEEEHMERLIETFIFNYFNKKVISNVIFTSDLNDAFYNKFFYRINDDSLLKLYGRNH
jgi:hypothetical protein